MTGTRWAAWFNVMAGTLLVVAPYALEYYSLSDIAVYEAVAVGSLICGIALWCALNEAAPGYLDYALALLGGWSIVAPFVLGYQHIEVARHTDAVVGAAVLVVSLLGHFYSSPVERPNATA